LDYLYPERVIILSPMATPWVKRNWWDRRPVRAKVLIIKIYFCPYRALAAFSFITQGVAVGLWKPLDFQSAKP